MSEEAESPQENEITTNVDAEQVDIAETQEDSSDPEAGAPEPEEQDRDSDDDEVVVIIEGTPTPEEGREQQAAPAWVKELRKSHRDTQRKNRELEAELKAIKEPVSTTVTLGAKPTLESYDYDTEKYEQELTVWYNKKLQVDRQEAEIKVMQEKQQEAWQSQLDAYVTKKNKLKVEDFDEAESTVFEAFDETQQGIVIQGADDAALTFYAIGNNPSKLKELSSIKDPVKFSFAVAKLETQLKVKNRKAPPPERAVSGTAPKSGAVDSNLERLREEAAKSGDYSKVHKYKKQQKLKAKK